ncbi:O-antigen ligase family protein [Candidatus Kaiserbacteria bacterium]|nr:O-antigen ligase family protein [Candidatus Kaiserbacteria bacterium]
MRYSIFGIAAAGFGALLPFVTNTELFYSTVNGKFFFGIFAIDVLLLWGAYLLAAGKEGFAWKRQWLLYVLGVTLVVHYAAAFLGVFPERSLWSDILRQTGVLYLTHIAVFAVLLGQFLRADDWSLVRRAIIVSGGIVGLSTIVGAYGLGLSGKILWLDFGKDGFMLGNGTFAGAYLLLAFLIGAVEFVCSQADVRWRRILGASLAAIAISPVMLNIGILFGRTPLADVFANPALILGSARASSAALLVLLVFLAGYYLIGRFGLERRFRYALAFWAGLILAGMFAAVALLFVPSSFVQKAYIESSTAARLIVWESSFEAFWDRPALGWGPENFVDAFERHFDDRLYLGENGGEIWFDRAHNIVVDTLVGVGIIGTLSLALLAAVYFWVLLRAFGAGLIGKPEAILLAAVVPAHFLQLQTGFDSVGSYVLLAVIGGYALSLERGLQREVAESTPLSLAQRALAAALVVGVLFSVKFVLIDEYNRQNALRETFTAPFEKQRELVRISLSQASDWESLRLSASSFIKGALVGAEAERDLEKRKAYVAEVLKTAAVYDEIYQQHLEAHPKHYRLRMNYVYLLLIETLLGEFRLNEAREITKTSYELSPENPLTPAMDALIFLYGINFEKSRERIDAAIAMNPEILFPNQVKRYIEEQIKIFPRRTVLQLENI